LCGLVVEVEVEEEEEEEEEGFITRRSKVGSH